jgi:hypothetical protein
MAVVAASVTVATTATLLSASSETDHASGQSVMVKVPTGGATVYIGGSGVTSAAGFPVAAGEATAFDLSPEDALYGITASGTQAVNVLRTGV